MKLKLGVMSNKELADWFGIKEGSFKNNKKKKLEVLKDFAEFEEKAGKIYITKIYNGVYSKQGSKSYQKIKDKVDECWYEDGLDSCKRVGEEVQEVLKGEVNLSSSTIYDYTRRSRNELYGVPFKEEGSLGKCVYLWCKKEGEGINTRYNLLTDEEEEIKQGLIKKYFGDATEKQIFIKGMVEMGEIRKEEAWELLEELTNMKGNNFMLFLGELQDKIGCQVVRGTLVERKCVEKKEF
jgi:hypothetical protein